MPTSAEEPSKYSLLREKHTLLIYYSTHDHNFNLNKLPDRTPFANVVVETSRCAYNKEVTKRLCRPLELELD